MQFPVQLGILLHVYFLSRLYAYEDLSCVGVANKYGGRDYSYMSAVLADGRRVQGWASVGRTQSA